MSEFSTGSRYLPHLLAIGAPPPSPTEATADSPASVLSHGSGRGVQAHVAAHIVNCPSPNAGESPKMPMEEVWNLINAGKIVEAETAVPHAFASGASEAEVEYARAVIAYLKRDTHTALVHAGRAIAADPSLVPAINFASRVLYEMRDFAKSLELAQVSLELEANDRQMILHAGRCLVELKRPTEAIDAFVASLELGINAHAFFGLASAFLQLDSSFDAIEALEEGLKFEANPAALSELMTLHSESGEPSRALEIAQRILKADPANRLANLVAAKSLVDLNSPEESKAFWDRAKAGNPEPWMVDRLEASALSTLGQFESAQACLERSIEAQPNQGGAYHLLFVGRTASEGDRERIDKMEALATSESLPLTEQAPLEFGLGKVWDDLGDPERAMTHFDRANSIRHRMSAPFDQVSFADAYAVHREIFSSPMVPTTDKASDVPIFVLGMMRSGTTLLEQMLAAHSQVVGAGELDFWPASEKLLVDRSARKLIEERIPNRRNAYLRLLESLRKGEKRVVDKNPENNVHAGLLHRVFPNAPIIHLRRNPVDTALSMWMTDGSAPFMSNREDIVSAIRESNAQADYWLRTLPPNRILDVRYEDLVREPEKWMRIVIEFCGLEWEDACLSAHKQSRPVTTASVWQVRQPVYQTSVGRAKRYEPWLGEFAQLL